MSSALTGMDRPGWVQNRRRRYLATVLHDFERNIEPLLPQTVAAREAIENFKGTTRAKMNALAVDAIDVYATDGFVLNQAAQDTKDRLFPLTGRP